MPTFSLAQAGTNSDDFMCNICMEPWMEPLELVHCGHIFCGRCVAKLKNKKCPTCRTTFKSTAQPNRIMVNQAKEIIVRCDNCTWVGSRALSVNHEMECSGDPEGARAAREARAAAAAEATAQTSNSQRGAFSQVFDFIFGGSRNNNQQQQQNGNNNNNNNNSNNAAASSSPPSSSQQQPAPSSSNHNRQQSGGR